MLPDPKLVRKIEKLKDRAGNATKRYKALRDSLLPHLEKIGLTPSALDRLEAPNPELFADLGGQRGAAQDALSLERRLEALFGSLKPHLDRWGLDARLLRDLDQPRPDLFAGLFPEPVFLDREPMADRDAPARFFKLLDHLAARCEAMKNQMPEHSGFAELLGYLLRDHLPVLRARLNETGTDRDACFRAFFEERHDEAIHHLFAMHAYSRLAFQPFDHIDECAPSLERLTRVVRRGLEALFGMKISTIRLFEERFDPQIHDRATHPTLLRFADAKGLVRAEIHKLETGVIHDITEVGLHSEKYKVRRKPRVVIKA